MVAFKIIGVKSVVFVEILLAALFSTFKSKFVLPGVSVNSMPVGGTTAVHSVINASVPNLYFSVPAELAAIAQSVT